MGYSVVAVAAVHLQAFVDDAGLHLGAEQLHLRGIRRGECVLVERNERLPGLELGGTFRQNELVFWKLARGLPKSWRSWAWSHAKLTHDEQ